jgi:hypothetical protein
MQANALVCTYMECSDDGGQADLNYADIVIEDEMRSC